MLDATFSGGAIARMRTGRLPAGWQNVLAWLVGVQLAFWLLVLVVRPPIADPVFEATRLHNDVVSGSEEHAPARSSGAGYLLGKGPVASFGFSLHVERPDLGLMVFAPRYNRTARLEVNGRAVPSADVQAWRMGRLGGRWVVAPGMLEKGRNRLVVHVERECCRAYLASLHAGPPGLLDPAIRAWRLEKLVPGLAVVVLGLFGALACLYLALHAIMRSLAFAASASLAGIALGALWQVDIFTPSSEALFNWAGQAILALTLSALVALADRWFDDEPRYDRALRIAAPLFLAAITLLALVPDGVPGLVRIALEAAMALAANGAIVGAVVRGLRRSAKERASDAAILLLIPAISLVDVLDAMHKNPLTLNSAPLGMLALVAMMLFWIVRRGRVLFARAEQANALLAQRIADKERELEDTAALLRQREAEAAVQAERARIMRDMHDGMGGHLLSVLMLARDEGSQRTAIVKTTEQAIDDLRLLIDSLDSVGDSFAIALGQFRDRAETKLRAAGIALLWSNQLGAGGAYADAEAVAPNVILTVYRILQEAVNNAVRHAACDALEITIRSGDAGLVEISVRDNGIGLASGWAPGRGLSNMKERVQAIGGTLEITPAEDGTRLTFAFAIEQNNPKSA